MTTDFDQHDQDEKARKKEEKKRAREEKAAEEKEARRIAKIYRKRGGKHWN